MPPSDLGMPMPCSPCSPDETRSPLDKQPLLYEMVHAPPPGACQAIRLELAGFLCQTFDYQTALLLRESQNKANLPLRSF